VLAAVLALYFGYARGRWRGLAVAAVAVAAVFALLSQIPGSFQQRLGLQASEAADAARISSAQRLEMYHTSLEIIREHPLLGIGTGAFPKAYAARGSDNLLPDLRNPHNEYLLFTVQIGLPGLAALLCLFGLHWRLAPRLATPLECHLARGLVVAIAAGCLFNSLLLDHTEGLLYAWLTGTLFAGLQSRNNG
jgi:O-antigen ligase